MSSVLYVIDLDFTKLLAKALETEEGSAPYENVTMRQLGEFQVIARPDGPDSDHPVPWDSCVAPLIEHVEPLHPTRLIVLGHKGIFSGLIPMGREQYSVQIRIPAAEKTLREQLPQPTPAVSVYGFHHEQVSEIWRMLEKPEELVVPGTLARLRAIVDEGGGPLGQLSALRHELMRPFASMRLRLQLHEFDAESVDRIVTAIAKGRDSLLKIQKTFKGTTKSFENALKKACSLLEEDPQTITADPDRFNNWVDGLNDALDLVRKEAR